MWVCVYDRERVKDCVCGSMWVSMCVSNLILLIGELPRGRGMVLLPQEKLGLYIKISSIGIGGSRFQEYGAPLSLRNSCYSVPTTPTPVEHAVLTQTFRQLWNSTLPFCPNSFIPIDPQAHSFLHGAFHPALWTTLETVIGQEASHSRAFSHFFFIHYLFYKSSQMQW